MDDKQNDFSGLKIGLASPAQILSWSHGEVTKPETINYRTFRAEKDGLFDERIFGPTKDYECYCGKYKRMRYKGIVCDRCGVEVTTSSVRRDRMAHIKLASPIAHIWYFKGPSAVLSTVLDVPPQSLERVIYYALHLVKKVDKEKQKEVVAKLISIKEGEFKLLDEEYNNKIDEIKVSQEKEKEKLLKKITNKEQEEIAEQESLLKTREKIKLFSDKFLKQKNQKKAFFDLLIKSVKSLKPLSVFEESHYLYLKEHDLEDFLEVGMGSEVVYEMLSSFDLKKEYDIAVGLLDKVKGDRRNKLLKKIRILESFIKSKIEPKWAVLTVLPVIPPGLRPVVQLPGGKFATSDLNDFYRRVINRNNRLKQLINLGAPEIILRNEKRMLQEAVDSLIDLQKSRGRAHSQRSSFKVHKSLSDALRGKQGRFRKNLLGKRVDYSARSTIIVGPELKLDQCGLPKEMALELFKPFILREIIIRGLAPNIKSAKNFLENREDSVYDILEDVIKGHPVLLNRAPTLHKLSILGFYPKLTDSYAIKLHPAVCSGFNADFDGDAMGVFLPLSKRAIDEIKEHMLPYNNLLKPSDGSPIVVPNKEMALGCYFITKFDNKYKDVKKENLKFFANEEEVMHSFYFHNLELREPFLILVNHKVVKTSVGRIMLNQALPKELRFVNKATKAADLKDLVVKATKTSEGKKVGELIDNLKSLGFWGATMSAGLSLSVFDIKSIKNKDKIIKEADKKVAEAESNYQKGLLTLEEKVRYSNGLWIEVTEKLAEKAWDALDEENPIKLAINSGGPRASKEQLKQLSAMKGLVVDPLGKIIEIPTKSNYREGLSAFEYVVTARGARKGLTDSALKTADAGYLTRRLVDISHDMIVKEKDCQTNKGLTVTKKGVRGKKFLDRIEGRFLAKDIRLPSKRKVLIKKGELIDEEKRKLIEENKIDKVVVRSPLYCSAKYGVCQKCYGIDLSTNKPVEIGVPVGVIAAQSIGEPGTQLTMRVRHFGGIVISDVTQGLPRVEQLFETRRPKVLSPISGIDGKVSIQEDAEKEVYSIKITSLDKESESQTQEFMVPLTQKLKIKDGQLVTTGTVLSEGYLNIKDILAINGLREAQFYLINEIQDVYESQGIKIHDKHFEVIIRKMSDKVIIEDEGETPFVKNEVVSRLRFEEENKKILSQGGKPAVGKISILGITRAAIYTDSWLSAASFEQTTGVLSKAAIQGKVDHLLGLKENVIIGRLIPVREDLINKYYNRSKYLNTYAHNKPASEEGEKKADKKDESESFKAKL